MMWVVYSLSVLNEARGMYIDVMVILLSRAVFWGTLPAILKLVATS